jgi:hypothetical protein
MDSIITLNPGKEDELETSIARSSHGKNIISFLLIINDKPYAGWTADAVPGDITRVEYGLGYVSIDTDKNFPSLLASTLEPEIRKDGSRKNIALYTVTITDGGVILILDKQIEWIRTIILLRPLYLSRECLRQRGTNRIHNTPEQRDLWNQYYPRPLLGPA